MNINIILKKSKLNSNRIYFSMCRRYRIPEVSLQFLFFPPIKLLHFSKSSERYTRDSGNKRSIYFHFYSIGIVNFIGVAIRYESCTLRRRVVSKDLFNDAAYRAKLAKCSGSQKHVSNGAANCALK